MLGLALADMAMPAPYGIIFNAVFAVGALVVAGEGLRVGATWTARVLFGLELLAAGMILVAIIMSTAQIRNWDTSPAFPPRLTPPHFRIIFVCLRSTDVTHPNSQ